MPIIDFKEIPIANTGTGEQDTFELFARDFFHALGFEIEENPSRGADGGKDLLLIEHLDGRIKSGKRRWIVSCKHYAHSKKSVTEKDEIDIIGRVNKFDAQGFIAFYSRIPSSGLMQALSSYKSRIDIDVWDNEKIENALTTEESLQIVFQRYFPKSYKNWKDQDRTPKRVFHSYTPLECCVCKKDLLPERSGNVALAIKLDDDGKKHIRDVYWACLGEHDRYLERKIYKELRLITEWESIDDLSIPIVYVRWFIATMNNLRNGRDIFTDDAFEKFKEFTLCMSQIVVKETTPDQWERIESLSMIPSWAGGLGE